MELNYSSINIYDGLNLKYREYLKPEIVSISIIQTADDVYLESVEIKMVGGGLENQTIKRINLDFITDGDMDDELCFEPNNSIENNARKFIDEFTPYSIISTTDLFTDEAADKINKKYNTFGVDK